LDQFQGRTVNLGRIEQFCDAVDKNGEGIIDPSAHLTCYQVKRPRPDERHEVISIDQFSDFEGDGPQQLTVHKRKTQLCVPSAAILETSPTPTGGGGGGGGGPSLPTLDHFELYQANTTNGTPRFDRREVSINDSFMNITIPLELKKPVALGVPTNKNGEGIFNSVTHLTCYSVNAPRFQKQHVDGNNQFGDFRVRAKRPNMLCVPSFKEVLDDDD
jgi:hypothetical protein